MHAKNTNIRASKYTLSFHFRIFSHFPQKKQKILILQKRNDILAHTMGSQHMLFVMK